MVQRLKKDERKLDDAMQGTIENVKYPVTERIQKTLERLEAWVHRYNVI